MIRFGWETFKKRPWFFIGIQALILIASSFASELSGHADKAQGSGLVLGLSGVFVGIVIQMLVKMGSVSFALKAHEDAGAAQVNDLWAPETFWTFLLASILVGLIIVGGIILLIVPGIIWALRYMFVPYLVVDRKLGVRDAMKESARITMGHKWQLLGLMCLVVLVNILGLIALIVGLLVSIPVTMFALAHAYRTLEHAASEVAPAPAAAL